MENIEDKEFTKEIANEIQHFSEITGVDFALVAAFAHLIFKMTMKYSFAIASKTTNEIWAEGLNKIFGVKKG